MDVVLVLPLAVVMVAGPQIVCALLLATSDRWRANSAAYLVGAALAIAAVVTVGYLLGEEAARAGVSRDWVSVAVIVLLAIAMVECFRRRRQAQQPRWVARLETATPAYCLRLGALLLGIFPSDLLTSLAVGGYLAADELPWWQALPFVGVTVLLLAVPSLALLATGRRAEVVLPKVRGWMSAHSWHVNEAVLAFFVLVVLNGLRS
jgi:Sap, sulfolipid-1-addressing protein